MFRSTRDIAIAVILIGGGLILLFSSPSKDAGPVSRMIYSAFRPVQEAIHGMRTRMGGVWTSYIDLVGVRQENDALKEEIRRLQRDKVLSQNMEQENRRLKKLLDLKAEHEFPGVVAQVTAEDSTGWHRTFFINRGSDEGVVPNMAVTVAAGLVGKVLRGGRDTAQVMLLTDPSLSVGCRVVRTRDRAVLFGSLDRGCVLRYIPLQSDIKPDDEVITSGLDGVFPKGLPVGRVQSVRQGDQSLFLEAQVMPAVEFSGVEEVMVVLRHLGGFDLKPGLEPKR